MLVLIWVESGDEIEYNYTRSTYSETPIQQSDTSVNAFRPPSKVEFDPEVNSSRPPTTCLHPTDLHPGL